MTKYNAIILPDKVFIADSSNTSWSQVDLASIFLFDGQKAVPTHKKGWYELTSLPKKVEKLIRPLQKCISYKLKNGFAVSDKLPQEVNPEFFAWDSDLEAHNNSEIMGLYEPIYSQDPEYLEQIEFEILTIAHKNSGWKFIAAPKNVQHYVLDEILNHPDLLQDEKCFLSSGESYKRIREFVKLNINPRVASVSSDYDFHFAVSKKISLCEKEKYQRNVKPFTKRPKYVDDYRTNRVVKVYEIAPDQRQVDSYKGSCLAPKFEGANYQDLEDNINNYLSELIEKINEPLQDCPHCKGTGVINP
jgi:hypothetical protein